MKRFSFCFLVCLVLALCGISAASAGTYGVKFFPGTDDPVSNMPSDTSGSHDDDCFAVPAEPPVREGYRFEGWEKREKKMTTWKVVTSGYGSNCSSSSNPICTYPRTDLNVVFSGEGEVGSEVPVLLPKFTSAKAAEIESIYGYDFSWWDGMWMPYTSSSSTMTYPGCTNVEGIENVYGGICSCCPTKQIVHTSCTDTFFDGVPEGVPETMILDEDPNKNVITILYSFHGLCAPGSTTLAIRCVNAENETELPYGEIIDDLQVGSEVTVDAPAIEGFRPVGEESQRFTVTADAEENIVTFRYVSDASSHAEPKGLIPDKIGFFSLTH